MKASLLKNIRHPESENRRNRINYKIMTFVVCLVVASFLWLMNVLSKKYTESIEFQVTYEHLPQDKKLYSSSESVAVKVTATGFNIIAYTLGIKDHSLSIDANQFRHRDSRYLYNLSSKTHMDKLEDQLGDDMKVVDISPDTLYLSTTPIQD